VKSMTSDYTVGRGKPPAATRFKRGVSGNPSGRPKQIPTLRQDLIAELGELAPGDERVTRQRALVRTLLSAALGGNLRAVGVLVTILGQSAEPRDAAEDVTDRDLEILRRLSERDGSDGAASLGEAALDHSGAEDESATE
jgi:hypothetical protein